MCTSWRTLAVIVVLGLFASPTIHADTVQLRDGRSYTGNVLTPEGAPRVSIDTIVSRVRVTLHFDRSDVQKVERKPLPQSYFDPKPKNDLRDVETTAHGDFLVVPVIGRIGSQVRAEGVDRALRYALRQKISTIVFEIDSHGGDAIAAGEIYSTLEKHSERLEYIAVVRDATGVALAIPVWCDRTFVRTGARVGGVLDLLAARTDLEDPSAYLEQVAFEVSQVAATHGWPELVVRAMIDPNEEVVGWSADGEVQVARVAPASVSAYLFESNATAPLTLSSRQAIESGLATGYDGSTDRLGVALERSAWKSGGDFGRRAMIDAAREHAEKQVRLQSRLDSRIKKNIAAREKLQLQIDRNLARAHEWDPQQEKFSRYREYEDSWSRFWGSDDGPELNEDEKRRWRQRTDATVSALQSAYRAIKSMKKLDKRADDLGLDPSYPNGEHDLLMKDIELKIRFLVENRNRRFR